MIRNTTSDDHAKLISLATATGIFEDGQTEELSQMLASFNPADKLAGDIWLTDDDDGPVGVAYLAPERMTEGTWNLYFIAVHPDRQREGRGLAILNHVIQLLSERGQRVLLVETAGTDDFDYVRKFYGDNGFTKEATIREFYTAGVDKVVYRRALN
ncbi:MAG: GNAT family N-acetyltransferase [Thermosynechococcaceae cyanobacterium]